MRTEEYEAIVVAIPQMLSQFQLVSDPDDLAALNLLQWRDQIPSRSPRSGGLVHLFK